MIEVALQKQLDRANTNAYQLSKLTGISNQCLYGIINHPYRIPRNNTVKTICKSLSIKPSDLILIRDDLLDD